MKSMILEILRIYASSHFYKQNTRVSILDFKIALYCPRLQRIKDLKGWRNKGPFKNMGLAKFLLNFTGLVVSIFESVHVSES